MNTMTLAALAAALAAQSAAAASPATRIAGAPGTEIIFAGQHVLLAPRQAGKFTPPPAQRRDLTSIFNNFASAYPKGLYNAFTGLPISGPETIHGQYWFAAAFTPTASATVKEIQVAAGEINGLHPNVEIGLYADASGVPGTQLWSSKTTLPSFGTCCAIVTLHDKNNVALTAGTQYWLGITTPPKNPTFSGAWTLNVLDQVDSNLIAINTGAGWSAQQSVPNVAFGIYGK